jgi:hypothetical protein
MLVNCAEVRDNLGFILGGVLRIPRFCALRTTIDSFGVWTVAVTTPLGPLSKIGVLIKRIGEP